MFDSPMPPTMLQSPAFDDHVNHSGGSSFFCHVPFIELWKPSCLPTWGCHKVSCEQKLNKVGTKEMLADFLTKGVSQEIMKYCMKGLNLYFKSGASKLALKA